MPAAAAPAHFRPCLERPPLWEVGDLLLSPFPRPLKPPRLLYAYWAPGNKTAISNRQTHSERSFCWPAITGDLHPAGTHQQVLHRKSHMQPQTFSTHYFRRLLCLFVFIYLIDRVKEWSLLALIQTGIKAFDLVHCTSKVTCSPALTQQTSRTIHMLSVNTGISWSLCAMHIHPIMMYLLSLDLIDTIHYNRLLTISKV